MTLSADQPCSLVSEPGKRSSVNVVEILEVPSWNIVVNFVVLHTLEIYSVLNKYCTKIYLQNYRCAASIVLASAVVIFVLYKKKRALCCVRLRCPTQTGVKQCLEQVLYTKKLHLPYSINGVQHLSYWHQLQDLYLYSL